MQENRDLRRTMPAQTVTRLGFGVFGALFFLSLALVADTPIPASSDYLIISRGCIFLPPIAPAIPRPFMKCAGPSILISRWI